jgi:hypothetical protein
MKDCERIKSLREKRKEDFLCRQKLASSGKKHESLALPDQRLEGGARRLTSRQSKLSNLLKVYVLSHWKDHGPARMNAMLFNSGF